MRNLVIRVVVDVDGHVFVKVRQGRRAGWISSAAWDFGVLHATELVVLNPKISLEYLERRWEAKQGRVSILNRD